MTAETAGRGDCVRGEHEPRPIEDQVRSWQFEHLLLPALLVALSTSLPAAPPEKRCMGRRCRRVAVVLISAVDEGVAAHTNPARLCEQCASRLEFPSGYPVDIFRWLTDCRVEANA